MKKLIVIIAVLLTTSYAEAQIAYQTGSATDGGNNGGSTTSLTFAVNVGSGTDRGLVVGIIGDIDPSGNDDISSVTFNGDAMTLAVKLSVPSQGAIDGRWTYMYVLPNPDAGSHNVVITAGSTHYLLGLASSYTGVNQSTTMDGSNTATLGAPIPSPASITTSVTTTADNCWNIVLRNGFSSMLAPYPTAGTGSTIRAHDAALGYFSIFDSNGPKTPAGSYSMTTEVLATTTNVSGQIQISWAPPSSPPPPSTDHNLTSTGVGR